MDTDTRARALEERYGTHRPVRRVLLIVVTVLVAGAGLGWLAWAAWINANPAIAADVVSFDVTSTHRVDTTVQVRMRDQYVTGSCLLRATAVDHSIVGELTMPVGGPDDSARQRSVSLRTERRATTVEVLRCTGSD